MKKEPLNKKSYFEALFLGPKADNSKIMEELILDVFRDHIFWRRNFHPEDPFAITEEDKLKKEYTETINSIKTELYLLLNKLKNSSQPFPSPRYLGHMNSDILMPAILGYIATLLYNPNNVAYEGSPATTQIELEAGKQLASLVGFNPDESWGHLTSGGTIANYESLWVARNLKHFPIALKNFLIDKNISIKELNALSKSKLKEKKYIDVDDISLLKSADPVLIYQIFNNYANKLKSADRHKIQQEVLEYHIINLGLTELILGKVFIPATLHYSWKKIVDILGLGRESIEIIKVDKNYRMDISDLKKKLIEASKLSKPVLAVVGIVGTTEEGAIDPVEQLVSLKKWADNSLNLNFYLHIDAAYGGYLRSIFFNSDSTFQDYNALITNLKKKKIVSNWPSRNIYNSFRELRNVDSITIDPHKLGYIPYSCGAVIYKKEFTRDLIACFAPYVFRETGDDKNPQLIGMYILEGSKPGAAAAASYFAHKVVGLYQDGYGTFLGETLEGTQRFYRFINSFYSDPIRIRKNGKIIKVTALPLYKPDSNIICYAFNKIGNHSLEKMNKLNRAIKNLYKYFSGQAIHKNDFIVSSTELSYEHYGEAPLGFLKKLSINYKEYILGEDLFVLRSCILSPYLSLDYIANDYLSIFREDLKTS